MKDLSIIIPVYNTEKYLDRCINSLIKQNGDVRDKYEIIIINDGSTDNSNSIITEYASKYPDIIKSHSIDNSGISIARNIGLDHAIGRYIWFVDSDDYVSENSIHMLISSMNSQIEGIAISYTMTYDNKPDKYIKLSPNCTNGIDLLTQSNHNPAQFCIFRKDFLDINNLRFIEKCMHEDVDFSTRAKFLAKNIKVITEPLYFFYQRQESVSRGKGAINSKRAFDCLKVTTNLYNFALLHSAADNYYIIANAISTVVNISLSIYPKIRGHEKKEFYNTFKKLKKEISFIRHSKKFRYRLEGIITKWFPTIVLLISKLK